VGGARRWVLNGGPLPVLESAVPSVRLMVSIPSSSASNNRVIDAREKDGLLAQPTHGDAAIPEDHFEIRNEQLANLKREVDGLKVALASRTVIGIALGIIIEREHVTETKAFQILKRMSQHSNVKLRDIAAQMVKDAQRSYRQNPRRAVRI
jgi:hypothetical protein